MLGDLTPVFCSLRLKRMLQLILTLLKPLTHVYELSGEVLDSLAIFSMKDFILTLGSLSIL